MFTIKDPASIENFLLFALNDDDRYAMSKWHEKRVRERLGCKVYCVDCSNNIRDVGVMQLRFDKPSKIMCLQYGFV